MKVRIEEEIPKHKRTKGKKHFKIESRLTPEGLEKKVKEYRKRNKRELEWSSCYTKYEHLKGAEQALKHLEHEKNHPYSWYNPYEDCEFRIVDDRG